MRKIFYSVIMIICFSLLLSGCNLIELRDRINSANEAGNTTSRQTVTFPGSRVETEAITEARPLTPAQIFEYNADAVFTIFASYDNKEFDSYGSGFFISSSGVAVTNHHVMVGAPYAYVLTHSGEEYDISGYYYYDEDNDLALIQVKGEDFPYLTIGDSDSLRVGENIFTIGSPLGYTNTFSTGIISRFDDVGEFDTYTVYGMIQFTAPISPGSSGGALLNDFGHAVGITTAGYFGNYVQAINFAVPSSRIDHEVAQGEFSQLPVGSVHSIPDSALIGAWFWDGGYYVFDADGTGFRDWDGYEDAFTWRILSDFLVLRIEDGTTERWHLNIYDEYEITVGGAWFFRAMPEEEAERALVGRWSWRHGWYEFAPNGTGSREWSGVPDTFKWYIDGIELVLQIDYGNEERWIVDMLRDNEITIGGAVFIRAT